MSCFVPSDDESSTDARSCSSVLFFRVRLPVKTVFWPCVTLRISFSLSATSVALVHHLSQPDVFCQRIALQILHVPLRHYVVLQATQVVTKDLHSLPPSNLYIAVLLTDFGTTPEKGWSRWGRHWSCAPIELVWNGQAETQGGKSADGSYTNSCQVSVRCKWCKHRYLLKSELIIAFPRLHCKRIFNYLT